MYGKPLLYVYLLYLHGKFFRTMKNRIFFLALTALSLASCRSNLSLAHTATQKNISITANIPEDDASKTVIEPYKKLMEAQMNSKISHTNFELTKTGDNSNLGNLLADYTLQGAQDWASKNNIPQVDGAVINIGGIRSTIGKGDILLKHIFEVMPFENEVVIVKMTGKEMQGLFDYYLQSKKNNPVSGFVIETDKDKLVQALVGGKNLDENKTYYIATSDYLALGGDNMKFFSDGKLISTGIKLRDLFVEKFRANPEIVAPTDNRLIFNKK